MIRYMLRFNSDTDQWEVWSLRTNKVAYTTLSKLSAFRWVKLKLYIKTNRKISKKYMPIKISRL